MPSPVKWMTDAQYDAAPLPERVLAWADSQVGIRESAPNRGSAVDEYVRVAGLDPKGAHNWCAAYVYWCLLKAGVPRDALPVGPAGVRNWARWGHATGRDRIMPGRARIGFRVKQPILAGHIWFCLDNVQIFKFNVGDLYRTIEGNTNIDGSSNGVGVFKRKRVLRPSDNLEVYGFIELEGLPFVK